MRRIYRANWIGLCAFVLGGCSGVKLPAGTTTQAVSVTITPASAKLSTFGTQNFEATVAGSSNAAVSWQVNNVVGGSALTGFISSTGIFAAPHAIDPSLIPAGGGPVTISITAVSQANSTATASASITLVPQQQAPQAGAVKLGTSGGNMGDISGKYCCSGTLGSLVTLNGTQYILSNNHVLAMSDSANLGDTITQPGLIESNCQVTPATQTVAHLYEFYNLETGSLPKVDAALATVVNGAVDANGNILLLGATETAGAPDAGPPHAGTGLTPTQALAGPHNGLVAKSGRTTGLTCSTIIGTNVTANVDYFKNCGAATPSFTVNYTDLVAVAGGAFSAAGDSGSLIVTQDTADPVALLFGGSDTDSVGNPVGDVLAVFPGAGNATPTFVGGAAHAVIGCSLPANPNSVTATQSNVAADALAEARRARDYSAPTLLANPVVEAIGFGNSFDRPGEAAVLLFVGKGRVAAGMPMSLNGVPTRILESDTWEFHGLLSDKETRQLLQSVAQPQLMYPLLPGQMQKARAAQAANMGQLLKQPGVLGVGISSSVDAPGEAALLVYVKHGTATETIPAEVGGVRTRVRETSPFVAGKDANAAASGCKVFPVTPITESTNASVLNSPVF